MNNSKTLRLTSFALLAAIEALFCFTPLGSIPIGPMVATLAMLPVVITAVLFGTKAGTFMGAIAGVFSLIVWTFMPPNPATAFVFTPFYSLGELHGNAWSLVICLVPRILTGTVAGAVYSALSKCMKGKEYIAAAIAGAVGSIINTVGVMGGIWLFFGNQYSSIVGEAMLVLIGSTVLTNGIPEAIVSAIACPAVSTPLKKVLPKLK